MRFQAIPLTHEPAARSSSPRCKIAPVPSLAKSSPSLLTCAPRSLLPCRPHSHLLQVEWKHFETLNHLIPSTTPTRDLDLIEYPNRSDPATLPIKEGVLERKKRFVKNWTSGPSLPNPPAHHILISFARRIFRPHSRWILARVPLLRRTRRQALPLPLPPLLDSRADAGAGTLDERTAEGRQVLDRGEGDVGGRRTAWEFGSQAPRSGEAVPCEELGGAQGLVGGD